MGSKRALFNIKGMSRDLAASKFSSEFAYENMNMRLVATDDHTSLALTNEKGTKGAPIIWDLDDNDEPTGIPTQGDFVSGMPIGQQVLDDNLILFTAGNKDEIDVAPEFDPDDPQHVEDVSGEPQIELNISSEVDDNIYKFWFDGETLKGRKLFQGDLKFSRTNPIECIGVYENEGIQKVYWTDGINPPRVINAAADKAHIDSWDPNAFNFVNDIKLRENITVTRDIVAGGVFAPGTIQYVFTYYKLYGQETNIFYTSPLLYTSYADRGASPDDTVSNSFTITLGNLDTRFDYVRVYSVLRTSLDTTPQVRQVVDLEISKTSTDPMIYVDNGIGGETVDATKLLYVGGEEVIVGTMEQKDNTLFLGDIHYDRLIIPEELQTSLKDLLTNEIGFFRDDTPVLDLNMSVLGEFGGYYNYESQLKFDSNHIKGFKYLEWYRLGLQFQFRTGRWSDPVWVGDFQNTTAFPSHTIFAAVEDSYGYYNTPLDAIFKVCARTQIDAEHHSQLFSIFEQLLSLGYVKVRPVVVYPKLNDRDIICQGFLCPTVYNAKKRIDNAPFAQASWFARPNAPSDVSAIAVGDWFDDQQIDDAEYKSYIDDENFSEESRAGSVHLNVKAGVPVGNGTRTLEFVNMGAWNEFRHNRVLPNAYNRNAEIQGSTTRSDPNNATFSYSHYEGGMVTRTSSGKAWASTHQRDYFVDQSIITLHSPDIEFSSELRNLDYDGLKLRIIGIVPLTAFDSNIEIESENSTVDGGSSGFYYESVNAKNASVCGWKALISAPMWSDGAVNENNEEANFHALYAIYPWHSSGSLCNAKEGKYSKLVHKTLSNTRFSYNTLFYDSNNIWKAEVDESSVCRGVTGMQVFNSNEVSTVKLPSQGEGLPDIYYYGNADQALLTGGNIMVADETESSHYGNHDSFILHYNIITDNEDPQHNTLITESYDPISIRYKSTPHVVMALRNTEDNLQKVLPTFRDNFEITIEGPHTPEDQYHPIVNDANYILGVDPFPDWIIPQPEDRYYRYFWNENRDVTGVYQDVLSLPFDGDAKHCKDPQPEPLDYHNTYATRFGFLWLGEIYNDSIDSTTRFGGNTPEALANNEWVCGGNAVSLVDDNGQFKDTLEIDWTEGDTYYQRYDCLKTYPFAEKDTNSIVEIVSFMCETKINIDGRYDKARGINPLYARPENFNKINMAYSQLNNYFNYRDVNFSKLLLSHYPNTIFWTKTKTLGEEIDSWTNVTLASFLDLDGDKGTVRALRKFNNTLFSFQDTGISRILYNDNVQISSTLGVPIEIANSGKVSGKDYFSNHIGCTNKWSISSTSTGLYFIDDRTKDLYMFNGQQFTSASDKLGFHSWMVQNFDGLNIWNPKDFESAVTYYDKTNQDIFFITKDACLGFNENLGNFSSFYSYEHVPYFANLEDRGIFWQKAENDTHYKPWLYREGKYNEFFGKDKAYWTTVVVNPDPTVDKIFNNLEFRADSFEGDTYIPEHTFDKLTVWNEYQNGTETLKNDKDKISSLKKKFRIWRTQIPRNHDEQHKYKRDRMRNPWLYLKLSALEGENSINSGYKTVLHDLAVDYFE